MGLSSMLKRFTARPSKDTFEGRSTRLIIQTLVISSVVVYLLETFLMVFLEYFLGLADPVATLLDGLILVTLLFPINYFFIVRPMARHTAEYYRMGQELVKSNELLESFFSINDVLIAFMDADFNYIRVNQAYASRDGRTPADFVGKNHFEQYPNFETRRIFETVMNTGQMYHAFDKPFEVETRALPPEQYWDWSLLPVADRTGKVVSIIVALTDVTARKKAQLALGDSERRFRAAFNQTFQHSILLDSEGRALLVNQTALDFSGLTHNQIMGLPLWQFPWWDSSGEPGAVDQLKAALAQVAGGGVARLELPLRSASAEKSMVDITLKPIHDESGAPIMVIYEARDISERYRAEEALKRSEQENKRLYLAERSAHQYAESLRNAVLTLSASLNSGTVLDTLLDYLHEMIPYTSAHVELLEDEDHLMVRISRGEEDWEADRRLLGKRLEVSELKVFVPTLLDRQVTHCADTTNYLGSRYFPGRQKIGSWIAIPLLAGEQVVGLCILEHKEPNFFTPELVQLATTLTNQASVAIQNAWLFDQVRDGREQLQALSRRLVEVQEYERLYIARELHDEAGQALASLMIGLHRLELESGDQAAVIDRSRELKQVADQVLENLHRLAMDLRPALLDHLGLTAALRQHAEMVSKQYGLNIEFEAVNEIRRLPGEKETAIYRIVQEALTNVVRHARATDVDILVAERDGRILIMVEDNGVGFDPQTPIVNRLGVLGMRERAEMLGGKINIESAPGKGATIILEVPCQSAF